METHKDITCLCRRFERARIRNPKVEKALLSSIGERGIEDPLYVTVEAGTAALLVLDGFKRLRCAEKLGIGTVPVWVLSESEVPGILHFLRLATGKGLHPLEEAHLVEVLCHGHGLSVAEIAQRLGRGVSWVRMRLCVLGQMSEGIKERIFSGAFPFRSWLYSLQGRTRVHSPKEVEAFVERVSGQGLSTRDIELLCGAWFRGGEAMRHQMASGKLEWTLLQLKEAQEAGKSPLPGEAGRLLKDLDILCACLERAGGLLRGVKPKEGAFYARVGAKMGRVLGQMEGFRAEFGAEYGQSRKG